ncbi:MAG: hypothetical protein ABW101_18740 [Candidatus Thiodiazotropha sp.]
MNAITEVMAMVNKRGTLLAKRQPEKTLHAKQRMQDRGISDLQERLIREFGDFRYQKGGANIAYIPNKLLADLRKAIDKIGGVTLVLGESDKLVTAMHQNVKIRTTQYTC